MLQLTGVVEAREMRDQYRSTSSERGITIKSQAVRMPAYDGTPYALNMIDTPGRGLHPPRLPPAACEGGPPHRRRAGSRPRRSRTCTWALENDSAIIPVLNKIDLPGAQPEKAPRSLS